MKLKIILTLSAATLLLAACGSKDEAYYAKNLDKAEKKMQSCEADLEKAFSSKDKSKFEKVTSDLECKAAHNAISENKEKIRKEEREAQEREKAAKLAAIQAELNNKYKDMSWEQIITEYANSECVSLGLSFEKREECELFKEIYQKQFEIGKNELLKKDYESLLADENKYCARDKRRISSCTVWNEAAQEKNNQIVADFVKDYESFKTTYNQCFDKIKEAKNWTEKRNIQDAYPCSQAAQARNKLNLGYDFSKKME